jgi:hypothetical protein
MTPRAAAQVVLVVFAVVGLQGCARKLSRGGPAIAGPHSPSVPIVSPLALDRADAAARRAQHQVNGAIGQSRQGSGPARAEDVPATVTMIGTESARPASTAGGNDRGSDSATEAAPPASHLGGITVTTQQSSSSMPTEPTSIHPLEAVLFAIGLIAAVLAVPHWIDERRRRAR